MSRSSQIYSQPSLTGSGATSTTRLILALEALKAEKNPVRLEDFAIRNSLEFLLDENDETRRRLEAHERVERGEKTGLWSYRPDFDVKSPSELLTLLRSRAVSSRPGAPNAAGMKLAELRESYPLARQVIEEWAGKGMEREVLVLRKQDGTAKMVYWNEEKGVGNVDDEFKTLWHAQTIPDAVDLPRELAAEGLRTIQTHIDPEAEEKRAKAALAARGGKGGRGRGKGRKVRVQNTHLEGVDLSRDFVSGK
ncbi:hypothetical protein FA09DRAFT_344014 [Tilletiopsis washingtonensis]|uniref:Transcription initiation factor IIE subunit beta n=1 Tax=Tilletiopsis washingtonensis TaxID=58919 RepID=A0A316Z5J7_9BASI|nr:hypothetical protein FA09DRAFT_344014 [Tilletiopsis washingtonensis]PWN96232.1 hypothetical protein FA09DRAFT_344014 [Tilletiopsis washingtonensis]